VTTLRLYYAEPWRRHFDGRVVRVEPAAGRWRIWLDRTAFYPTSGGQPHDTGRLGAARVLEVAEDEEGGVVHVTDAPLAEGEAVRGEVDWPRRVDHMQQHTGQHLLSAAFERTASIATVSFRLGAEVSTIDLAREATAEEIGAAEALASRVVWEDRPVSIRFVSEAEAAALPLRKEPARGGRLRLVEVADFDLSACGGTHVSRTGEVGMVAVIGWERFRGGTRVSFVCGGRALAAFRRLRATASRAARLLSVHQDELPEAVSRLQEEGRTLQRALKALSERSAALEAGAIAARLGDVGGVRAAVEIVPDRDLAALRMLAAEIVREPGRAVVLLTPGTPAQVVAARSRDVARLDCKALVARLAGRFGGKGGGRPDSAQAGSLPGTAAAIAAAARELLDDLLAGPAVS
jgi:alanyl-tRNA synthetase